MGKINWNMILAVFAIICPLSVAFFVWCSNIDTRVTVIESSLVSEEKLRCIIKEELALIRELIKETSKSVYILDDKQRALYNKDVEHDYRINNLEKHVDKLD